LSDKKRIEVNSTENEILRAEIAYTRRLIDASLDPLVTIASNGKTMDVNKATEVVTGRSREELIGTDFSRNFTEQERARAGYQRVFDEGIVRDYALTIRHKDGHVTPLLFNATVYRDAAGKVAGIFAAARDISKLREVEENYQNIMNNLSEGFYSVTIDGIILTRNIEFAKILGFDPKESLVGKLTPNFWYDLKDRDVYLMELRKNGVIKNHFVTVKKRNGEKIFVEVSARMVNNQQNIPIRIEGMVVDITERKKAEEKLQGSEARFRSTFEQAAVGIAHTSIEGQFLLINQRFCDIVGYRREEMLKLTFQQITYTPDVEIDLNYHHQLLMGTIPTYSMEKRYIRKNNSIIWVNLTVSLTRETAGEPQYFITVIEDITTRKRAEEVLGVTVKALKRSNNELEQFAYVASHDLQEPLRMISSYVQLIARRYKGKLDADADDFINFAIDGAERMKTLINDLLAFSRVMTRGQPFASVNTTEVLTYVLQNLTLAIEEAKAVITYEPLPIIIADPAQLGQVFQNLIGNAIKFHGEQPPEIHVDVKQTLEEWVFSVKDNGIGIDPQYFDRMFKIFQRLNPNEQYPGTGIGLAVCKRIMERHGGRIWVESELGKGATFYFSIPIKQAEDIKNE
jgi:PAS domain S-box-containing protein